MSEEDKIKEKIKEDLALYHDKKILVRREPGAVVTTYCFSCDAPVKMYGHSAHKSYMCAACKKAIKAVKSILNKVFLE